MTSRCKRITESMHSCITDKMKELHPSYRIELIDPATWGHINYIDAIIPPCGTIYRAVPGHMYWMMTFFNDEPPMDEYGVDYFIKKYNLVLVFNPTVGAFPASMSKEQMDSLRLLDYYNHIDIRKMEELNYE